MLRVLMRSTRGPPLHLLMCYECLRGAGRRVWMKWRGVLNHCEPVQLAGVYQDHRLPGADQGCVLRHDG
jgi:hypothetical protein